MEKKRKKQEFKKELKSVLLFTSILLNINLLLIISGLAGKIFDYITIIY